MARAILPAVGLALALLPSCTIPESSPFSPEQVGPSGLLRLVGSVPADGATDVPRGSAVVLTFDGFPDPATLTPFGALAVRSGVNSFDFTAEVDLVSRSVLVQPRTPLAAGTGYAFGITTALRGLDGSPAQPTLVRLSRTLGTV